MEDRVVETVLAKQKKEHRILKNGNSLRDLWDNIKHNNILIIGVPEWEEKEEVAKNIFEDIIAENLTNLGNEKYIQVQEAQRLCKQDQTKNDYTKTHCN